MRVQVGSLISETAALTATWLPRALPLGFLSSVLFAANTYADNLGYYFATPMPELYWGTLALYFFFEILLAAALLRGMLRGKWHGITGARIGDDELNYFLSSLATMLIFVLAIIITLLPVSMSCLAVFASAGVDLDLLSSRDGWDQIPQTPRLIALGIFTFGLIVCSAVMARLIPYAAGAIDQRKVVAMQAFTWTKGNTVRITAAQFIVILIVLTLAILADWGIYEIADRVDQLTDGVLMSIPLLVLENLFWIPASVAFAAFSVSVYRTISV